MRKFIKAISIALKAHKGQKNTDGSSYLNHVFSVTNGVPDIYTKTVAVLHDVIEDTDYTIEDLDFLDEKQREALLLVTHNPEDTYDEYIKKMKDNPMAVKIKLSDLRDNIGKTNLDLEKNPNDKKAQARMKKYTNALEILCKDGEVENMFKKNDNKKINDVELKKEEEKKDKISRLVEDLEDDKEELKEEQKEKRSTSKSTSGKF